MARKGRIRDAIVSETGDKDEAQGHVLTNSLFDRLLPEAVTIR